MFILSSHISTLSVLTCGASFCSTTWAVRCLYCLWVKLSTFMWLTYYIHMLFSVCLALWYLVFQSSAGPSPGTTKNLNSIHLSLSLNFTVHMTNFSISDWLYVFNMTQVFLCHVTPAIMDFVNKILNTLNGIRLPWLLVSISYVIWALFWLVLNSNLMNIIDITFSKFNYLIFTKSKCLPLCFCFLM